MDWSEPGILLTARRHGENSAIVEAFTETRGRHAGLVRGGAGRRMAPILQPGAQLALSWRARMEDHLGAFTIEPVRDRFGRLASDPLALAGLSSVCALLARSLPERYRYPELYTDTVTLLDLMAVSDAWPLAYLRWELRLLSVTGFGLDLSACAVTGATNGLAHVSPRTGRAVAVGAAGPWADRMLPLPPCLLGQGPAPNVEIAIALGTTGHFLDRATGGTGHLPAARGRLVDQLSRSDR